MSSRWRSQLLLALVVAPSSALLESASVRALLVCVCACVDAASERIEAHQHAKYPPIHPKGPSAMYIGSTCQYLQIDPKVMVLQPCCPAGKPTRRTINLPSFGHWSLGSGESGTSSSFYGNLEIRIGFVLHT